MSPRKTTATRRPRAQAPSRQKRSQTSRPRTARPASAAHTAAKRRTPVRTAASAPHRTKQARADARMQVFAFAVAVFLALCALNLIGLTEYVETPKTESISYQVGDPSSFFNTLGPIAEDVTDYGLYPSVMLAQAALESNFGESQLSFDYNNYFGIKAHDHHRSVNLETTEYYDGQETTIRDYFCVYSSPEDCFKDYAELLTSNENYRDVIGAQSPAAAARALQAGGYATDPNYASKIIAVINEYNLTRFDPMERPEPQSASSSGEAASSAAEEADN